MARWKIALLAAGTLLAAGIVVALITVAGRGPSSPVTEPSKPTGPPPIAAGAEYVAIGDSYTSAPGAGPSANDCRQATTNYPRMVAAKLGLRLKDVSCIGAATSHVTAPQVFGSSRRPPQADALSPGTDLVTISLGANDFNIFGTVAFGCTALRFGDPSGAPCQEADAAATGGTVEQKTHKTEQRLVDTIRLVERRARGARIVVVGYPEFFPSAGPCAHLPLALGDYTFAHRVNELLVRAQARAAKRTKVEYVDVFTASRGHDMCAQEPWIAGLNPTRTDAAPWHPYPEEQQLVANLLIDLLTGAAPPNREQPAGR
jgi:lysophospholipase L1-like esterase